VPVIGLAWWALDFPFMKRGKPGGRSDLEDHAPCLREVQAHPHVGHQLRRGHPLHAGQARASGVAVPALLKPKAGGMAVGARHDGEDFNALLDVTIAYPRGTPTFWDLLCGRMEEVVVRVQTRPIPPQLVGADAAGTPSFRAEVQSGSPACGRRRTACRRTAAACGAGARRR